MTYTRKMLIAAREGAAAIDLARLPPDLPPEIREAYELEDHALRLLCQTDKTIDAWLDEEATV